MAQESSGKSRGCMRSMLLGIGCGCVYPIAMLVLFLFFGWFFLADPVDRFVRPVELPEFAGPEQEDFWKLQEKRLDLENVASPTLILKPSEFNAYLNAWQIPPAAGFCLQRARFVPGNDSGTFYLIGSGYMLRSMVIQIELKQAEKGLEAGSIRFNFWQVPDSGWVRRQSENIIRRILAADKNRLAIDYLNGQATFSFDADTITLSGRF